MLHPTLLDDVRPTCWLRLNRPLNSISLQAVDVLYVLHFVSRMRRSTTSP